ncbi:MAG: glycyl-radical enzyme activating protein [Bacteroidota bacterium]
MKGLIYDIKRFAIHDGPGIRTTVFFKGCPLDCWWCHNPESINNCIEKTSKMTRLDGKEFIEEEVTGYEITPEELMEELKKDRDFMEESGGGITFSGGEPLMQAEFLEKMLILCREENINAALDTSGYVDSKIFKSLTKLTDLFLFDLKHPDKRNHIKYTGVPADLVFLNLNYLHTKNAQVIIRIPLIPGVNDSKYINEYIELLKKDFPHFQTIHLLPYHDIGGYKYEKFGRGNRMKDTKKYSDEELADIKALFRRSGFDVSIGG